MPSESSRGDLNNEVIGLISFKETNSGTPSIYAWIDKIIKEIIDPENQFVIQLLEQFKKVIENMSNNNENNINTGLIDTLDREKTNTLYSICQNADEILRYIRRKYLRDIIVVGDDFELIDVNDKPQSWHNQALLQITHKNKEQKIWISLDRNGVYLIEETGKGLKGWKTDKDNTHWKYIPNKNQPLTLDVLDDQMKKIDITDDLKKLI